VILIAGGYFAVKAIRTKAPNLVARMIEASAETLFIQIELPETERGEAMAAVNSFTQDIRDGRVSLKQGMNVVQALDNKSLLGAIIVRGFEAQYVKRSVLPDEEKEAAHVTLTRFVHGTVEESIPQDTYNTIIDTISEKGDDQDTRQLKSSITTEELRAVLERMKTAADDAAIENREYAIDIAPLIRDAIERGMKEEHPNASPPHPGH